VGYFQGVGARRLFSYPLSLAVVVAALIAATGGWIAWWNYRSGLENIRTLANGLFAQVARQTVDATESYLRRAPPAAESMAGTFAIDRPQTSSDMMARRCAAVLHANEGLAWVSYSDRAGTFVGATRDGDKIRINRSALVQTTGKTLVVEHELAADGSLTQTKTLENDYDPRKRGFYKQAFKARKGVWTPPYVFAENVPGITYALPFLADNEVEGVFTIDFDLKRLSELARSLQFSPNGRVVIITDEDAIVLAHPTANIVATVDGKAELVAWDKVSDPALQAVLASSTGTEVRVDGTTYLAKSLPIKLPDGPSWRVIAFAPESDFTAGLGRRALSSLLISLAAILISVVVAWVLARRISQPLTYLAAEMGKVGEFRIEPGDQDHSMFREIEMMNTALAKMKGGLRSFASYVPRDLVRAVLASGQEARLAGDVRELTVYFSDLAGFTTLAETRKPDALVRFLGEYFDDMSKIIADERGTLDKYLGDGIMAFWGAPLPVPDHAARACVAALHSQRRLKELTPDGVKLHARIGIATGDVLVGNIGSTERLNYTVMGDTANLAARLESLNKQYGTYVMIDEATYEQAKSEIVARALDVVAVKGKQKGVRVYEVLALASDGNIEAEAIALHSTRALDAYLARRFDEAVAAWTTVLEKLPNDRCAVTLRDRATAFAALPPGPDWEGVTVITEK
jgi:adenylate cyclase